MPAAMNRRREASVAGLGLIAAILGGAWLVFMQLEH